MRWSKLLIPTLKQAPADARSPGHALLARAGLIHVDRRHGGISFLPLGVRTLKKLAMLASGILDDLDYQEVLSATDGFSGGSAIRSHKQIPQHLYQITHTPKAVLTTFGFDANETQRQKSADRIRDAVSGLCRDLRIPTVPVQTSGGLALAFLGPSSDSTALVSDTGTYAATLEVAETAPRSFSFAGEPADPLEKISTPGLTTVAEVCGVLKITARQILKTLVFVARSPIAIRWVVAVVRGDHQVNLRKLALAAKAMGVSELHLASDEEARGKWTMGFVGPDAGMRLADAVLIVDPDAARGEIPWVAGGNEADIHVRNFNWFRECGDRLADPVKVTVADIRNASDGDPSPNDSAPLRLKHASLLFTQAILPPNPELAYDDIGGQHRALSLSTSRLDLDEVLLAVANSHHDDEGLLWPPGLAPFSVVITAIQNEGPVHDAVESLYTRLTFDGIDVILDDRDLRAGPKFADADLIGFPLRITVGPRTVEHGQAEIKFRPSGQFEAIPLNNVPARVAQMLMDQ